MISEQAIQSATRHQVFLEGLKSGEVKAIDDFIRTMDRSIRERLSRTNINDLSRARLEKLLQDIAQIIAEVNGDHQKQLIMNLGNLAVYEGQFETKLLDDVVHASFAGVSAQQLRTAVFTRPLSVRGAGGGELLKGVLKRFTKKSIERVSGIINQGFVEGQTNQQIIDSIRGTKAAQYKNGHLALMKRGMEALVRTGVQHVASVARQEIWSANSDIVKGYQWVSTLDSRTTEICQSLDGREFKLDKGPLPPIHIGCRSTTVPTFYGDVNFKDEGATRSAEFGPVDADQTYYDWLKNQNSEFQDVVLGKTLGKVFRDGGLPSERFAAMRLDKTFKPLNLEQMKEIEPLAFKKAGIL